MTPPRLPRHQNKINLQPLHLAQQLQLTLNGPAFRPTQQFHLMGSSPLLLLQIHRLIHTCGELRLLSPRPLPLCSPLIATVSVNLYLKSILQSMVPPYGTPAPPYVMYPPGTVYAHPSTPPGMHPFSHYPMPTNGHAEIPGAAPGAQEMNGKSEPGRASAPSANGITSHSESGSESESEGSDANSQNDSHSKDNDGKDDGSSQNGISYSASQGMLNQTMPMLSIQPGAMVGGVPGSTANLNIGMDYWAAPSSAAVPATHGKAPAGSARGDQWDERELKKQKRKQSNRESARRSRLRKQAECEELGQRAESLRSENSSLRAELERIRKEYEQLLSQNASLKEKLGATSDSIPDMNEQNDGDGSYKKQPDSDAQPGNGS